MAKEKPVHTFEYPTHGGRIDFGIWENTVGEGDQQRSVYAVSFNRSYHEEGWKHTKSLRGVDLPVVIVGLQDCYRWILAQNRG